MTVTEDRYEQHLIPSVDLSIVADAARLVADALVCGEQAVEVQLCPGDSTSYQIVVSAPRVFHAPGVNRPWRHCGDGDMLVSLLTPDRRAYQWGPQNETWTTWDYVASHWDLGDWTARVLAAFLNMLRNALAVALEETERDQLIEASNGAWSGF